MPNLTASRRRALTTSAPASCPFRAERPLAFAQRPLPSVMIATYFGPSAGSATSDLEDLFFLGLQQLVELRDAEVGDLLQLDFGPVLVVRAGLAGLFELAQVVHDVAADVADRDAALLGDVADDLDQLLATLLGQLRQHEADHRAVVARRQPDVGLLDRPLDRLDRALVVRLDRQHPSLRRADRGQLLEGGQRPVVVDLDAIEESRTRAPRAHRAELVARRLHGLVHPFACVVEQPRDQIVAHDFTNVPTLSPDTIRSMF